MTENLKNFKRKKPFKLPTILFIIVCAGYFVFSGVSSVFKLFIYANTAMSGKIAVNQKYFAFLYSLL